MTNSFYIIILVIVLVVVVVFFAVIDRLLKGGSANKATPKKNETAKPVIVDKITEPAKAEKTIKPTHTMEIYNSELADDLTSILEKVDTTQSSRLQIENHMNRESNIRKYIQEKNYHGFDFNSDTDGVGVITDSENEHFTFNREDYKKFMVLSNIDDDKPL